MGTQDGSVFAAGDNLAGQLGDGTMTTSAWPKKVKGVSSVKSIAAGESHGLFLTGNGELWGTGANFDGQLGDSNSPGTPIKLADSVQDVFAGGDSSCFLKDSMLYGMGSNRLGQLGLGETPVVRTPMDMQVAGALLSSPADFHNVIMTNDQLYGVGSNTQGELGLTVDG